MEAKGGRPKGLPPFAVSESRSRPAGRKYGPGDTATLSLPLAPVRRAAAIR
jgi:hypothetical protein